ncbi:hypothetical protein Tco_0224973, partial [Tanacetum coccineum]
VSLSALESKVAFLEADKAKVEATKVSLRQKVKNVKRDRAEVVSKHEGDPHAPIKALLSKKPQVLQRPALTRTHVSASLAPFQKATSSSALVSQPLSPPLAN